MERSRAVQFSTRWSLAWFSDNLTWRINNKRLRCKTRRTCESAKCSIEIETLYAKFTGADRVMTVGCQIECKWIVKNGAEMVMNREVFDRRWPKTLTQHGVKLSISMRLDCYLYVTDWQEETEADHGPNGVLMKIRGGWKVVQSQYAYEMEREVSINHWSKEKWACQDGFAKSSGIQTEFCISEVFCGLVLSVFLPNFLSGLIVHIFVRKASYISCATKSRLYVHRKG